MMSEEMVNGTPHAVARGSGMELRCSRIDGYDDTEVVESRSSSTPPSLGRPAPCEEDLLTPSSAKRSLVSNTSSNSMSEVLLFIVVI